MTRITPAEMERIMCEEVPYVGQLNIRVEQLGDGSCRLRMPVDHSLLRPGGTVTGPAMMGLADIAMYACVLSRIGTVKLAVTTNLTANFLRRPEPADILAEGRLLKCGRRLAYGEVTLYSEGISDPVCHVTSTYSLPPGTIA